MKSGLGRSLKAGLLAGCCWLPVTVSADIELQPGLSGSWVVQSDGQGALINMADVGGVPTFVFSWYTFQNGGQIWLFGSSPYTAGSKTVTVPLSIASGADFSPDFQSADVSRSDWGEATFNFTACDVGTAQYTSALSDYGSGSVPLRRLTNTLGLTCDAEYSAAASGDVDNDNVADNGNTDNDNNVTPDPVVTVTAPAATSLVGRDFDQLQIMSEEQFEGQSVFSRIVAPGENVCHLRLNIKNASARSRQATIVYNGYFQGQLVATATALNADGRGLIPANDSITLDALWISSGHTGGTLPDTGLCSGDGTTLPPASSKTFRCDQMDQVRALIYQEILDSSVLE